MSDMDRSFAVVIDANGTPLLAKEASLRRGGFIRASAGSSRRAPTRPARHRTQQSPPPVRQGPPDVTAEARAVVDEQRRAMGPIEAAAYPVEWFHELAAKAGVRPAHNNTVPVVPPAAAPPPVEYDRTLFPEVGIGRRRGPGTITYTE